MATYTDTSVRHDACSTFDTDGFAINEDGTHRNWVPLWSDGREPAFVPVAYCDRCNQPVTGRA